jgi:transcriptional regulator with XRE-family HTH domain
MAALTPTDLTAWRQRLGLSKAQAAKALGVSYSMYRYYEAGQREDGRNVEIPRTVALACSAIACGLAPWEG